MNTWLCYAVFLLSLAGCSTVTYTTGDGRSLHYRRWGNQEIGSFYLEADGSAAFDRQKSDNETLYKAIEKLVEKLP